MAFLGFGKKKEVLDLTESYKRQVKKAEEAKQAQKDTSANSGTSPFSFFDAPVVAEQSYGSENDSAEERKKKLAKRIMEMTEKLEDLSNQIYHLQQRVEVLERKFDVRG